MWNILNKKQESSQALEGGNTDRAQQNGGLLCLSAYRKVVCELYFNEGKRYVEKVKEEKTAGRTVHRVLRIELGRVFTTKRVDEYISLLGYE